MAARRLSRIVQAGLVQSVNWTTQATETYDRDNPAEDPSVWGTEAEIAFLDRTFVATGDQIEHLGLLATFLGADAKPDRAFYGAQVKIQPTYTNDAAPFLELWTLKDAEWTIRRRVSVPGLARSGDVVIVDLTIPALFASDDAIPDAVWITLDTATDVTLDWLVCHLYGDCTRDPVPSDCPPGTDPEDCETPECSVDPDDWICTPIPIPPDLPPTDPFPFPPIAIDVLMPTSYTEEEDGTFTHECPAPTGVRMYFGELPGGGSVTVALTNAQGLVFNEGTVQTISAPGAMDWTIAEGYGGGDPEIGGGSAAGYLPPREVTHHITFAFTRNANDPFTLLDILAYFWTYDLIYSEACFPADAPPITGLPPAQDPPDDSGQTTYQQVMEKWFVFADTEENATLAQEAADKREGEYLRAAGGVLNYGLRPEDGARLRAALELTAPYLATIYDPDVCSAGNTTALGFAFTGLADGHVLTFRWIAVPTQAMMSKRAVVRGALIPAYRLNPFRNGAVVLPYNPTADIDTVVCPPGDNPNDSQSADLAQRFRWQLDFNVTPQLFKYAGSAIQPSAYHLERGVTEDVAFDTILLRPYPVPANPFATTWDPPCTPPIAGRCHQWYAPGWGYLLTVRVYEPVATPIGGVVDVTYAGRNALRLQVTAPSSVDGRWP